MTTRRCRRHAIRSAHTGGLVLAFASLFTARAPRADPQWSAGALTAGCLLGQDDEPLRRVAFCGALRGDVLFGRQRARDFGFGPYLSVGTAAFHDLRLVAGGSALAPLSDDFPLVVSLGGLLRDGTELGADGSIFWGVRGYNFHSSWNFAAGLVLGAQRTFGDAPDQVISVGVQIDGLVFALPVLLVAGAAE